MANIIVGGTFKNDRPNYEIHKSPWEKEKQNRLPNKQSSPFCIFHQKWEKVIILLLL
jgi:hypothetical protein